MPISRIEFTEYEVGDRFFLRQVPAINFMHYSDKKRTKSKLSPKLQRRYTGPYLITKKFSPVLYEAQIDGNLQTVHALKMQPDPTSKYYRMHLPRHQEATPLSPPQFKAQLNQAGQPIIRSPGAKPPEEAHERADEEEEHQYEEPED